MADNDQLNEEYQFSDLDAIGTDTIDQAEGGYEASQRRTAESSTNIKRNALIVVVLVILAMIIYKFLGSFFAAPKIPAQKALPEKTTVAQPSPPPQVKAVTPAVPAPVVQPTIPANVEQKLSALELSQQSLRSEVLSVGNQLGGISSNVNELTAQIAKLNNALMALNDRLEEQSREIERLMIRTKPKKTPVVIKKPVPVKKYYIQAVIPGRAWLISQNGTTLTVREGTVIPGYGTVKVIDPLQGRITTSSGQIIRFSQDDS